MRRLMHLRSLKLNGFKSFADATELKFDRGVTAVVGPNGCGKSNIADAIRWVLGEQSAKALRGGKMQDVIFEGTDSRKPLPLCEVSLLLTDCEEQLGTAFHEVEITRRVSRDGTSDYLLNGRSVRLKDIQKLFMDTGVGRTSYSIMAQGQIDQVLSSKPEERRAIFEEAAGITKYKSQRREALNKLALVDQNLARVTDVIAEVGRQIGTLKRQASKALRYRRLSHRLRHLDLAQSARTFETLRAAIRELEEQVATHSGELAQMQEDLGRKEAEVTERKAGRTQLLQRVQEAQQAVFDLRSQREQAFNQAHLADIRRNGLEERIAQARDEMAATEAQLTELSQRADVSAQDKQLQLDVLGDSDAIFQARNRELTEAEERLTRAEGVLQQLKYRTLEAESGIVRLRNDCANLEVEDRTAQARSERLEEELAEQTAVEMAASEALQAAQAASEAARQKQAAGQEAVTAAQQDLARLGAEFKEAQRRIQEIDRTIAQKTARLKLLQQLQEKLEGFGEGAKALMQGRLGGEFADRRFVPLSDGLKVEARFARAVETLLGAAVEAVLVDDAATVRGILEQIAAQKLGRACLKFPVPPIASGSPAAGLPPTILPAPAALTLTQEDADSHPVAGLLAGCYLAETAGDFLEFWAQHPEFEFHFAATLNGELIDRRGLVFGGQRKGGTGILQRAAEAKAIAVEIEQDQEALARARQVVDELNAKLLAGEAALEERRREHVEATRQVAALTTDERNAQRALQEAANRRERLEREREAIAESHRIATERLAKARDQFAAGEANLNRLRAEIEQTERDLATLRTERDVKREAVNQARFDLAEKRQRLEVLNRGLSEIEARRSALEEMRQTRAHEIDLWSAQIEELAAEAAQQRARAEESERTLGVAQESVEKTRQELVQLEEVLTVLEREQAYVRNQVDERRAIVSRQEVELAEKRARLQFLQEEVSREHAVELSAIDWRYELWMAGQQPEGLRPLDLDEEADEGGKSDEAKPPAEARADTGDAPAGSEGESPSADGKAAASAPQPTPEELAALETTDWEAVKNEVAALRQRVQTMGPVNLVAIDEYGELKQRFEFLQAQSNDLVNSKNELLKAIDEINRTSERQFSETFEQIRKNFAQTFTTLFGGGHVDLVLVEAQDVLESGIEIVAQPPGTRLKSISLLSGGQKTMTAVALLFAIYLVKPSPFCVLDELDAPLDESNIGRFTGLLKQFTEKSQFIMITHNKRTIAASKAIYGVTMEERGVSKVVSLRFHTEHHEPDMAQLQLALTPTGAEMPAETVAEPVGAEAAGAGPGQN